MINPVGTRCDVADRAIFRRHARSQGAESRRRMVSERSHSDDMACTGRADPTSR